MSATTTSSAASTADTAAEARLPSRGLAAIAGVVTALVAIGVGELVAGFLVGAPSPLASVGQLLIDLAPAGSKEVVTGLFGTNDKIAITLLIGAVVLLIGAGVGVLARTRPGIANGVILGVVGVGVVAALRDPTASLTFVLILAGLQAIAATMSLSFLLSAATPKAPPLDGGRRTQGRRTVGEIRWSDGDGIAGDTTRRGFLVRAGVLGGLAILGGGFGRMLLDRRAAAVTEAATVIPPPVDPVLPPPPDASFAIEGLTPLIVPNDDFYRIDTALITPAVDLDSWTLRVFGMVQQEVTLTFAQLMQLPLHEEYVTIACVSNEIGGPLVGNTKWTGVRLTDVLDMAGIQPGATQIVPRSVDGWTAGFPTAWIQDPAHPREPLIAVKMDGLPLPAEHGFPARLIVPGLYGYVSATKWLAELELTTLEAFDAYWVPRGWAKEAPILTQSRIDVPHDGSGLPVGPAVVAGVAWAPDRGISKVELSVDGGPWQAATLATELSAATWVQWKWAWQATPGDHVIAVRATDGTGEVQTDQVTRPDPNGAHGHHTIGVHVS